ncbi:hypothetical protein GJ496_006974 [Pomphorhynchus laevis]|nr:hypothetical protein GJ496_006974 [Pomphorhynchus laevis]
MKSDEIAQDSPSPTFYISDENETSGSDNSERESDQSFTNVVSNGRLGNAVPESQISSFDNSRSLPTTLCEGSVSNYMLPQRIRHLSALVEHPHAGINDILDENSTAVDENNNKLLDGNNNEADYDIWGSTPLFIELSELGSVDIDKPAWIERARWIKYEEDVDVQLHHWDAPHISILCFTDLLKLRNALLLGATLFNVDDNNINSVFENIVQNFISTGQLQRSQRNEILNILALPHRHETQKSIRTSVADFMKLKKVKSKIGGSFNVHQCTNTTSVPANLPNNLSFALRHPLARLEHIRANSSNSTYITEQNVVVLNQPDLMKRIPESTQAFVVMVGVVQSLSKPLLAFVRFKTKKVEDGFVEIPLPLKFLFVVIGPAVSDPQFYFKIGRTMCTLMNDLTFRQSAFEAKQKQELIEALSKFITRCMIFPVLEFDRIEHSHIESLANHIIEASKRLKPVRHSSNDRETSFNEASFDAIGDSQPTRNRFEKTKRCFGGYWIELKRYFLTYPNSLKNGFHLKSITTVLFLFASCLSLTLTFAGILSEETHHSFSVNEMLAVVAIDGIVFGLLAGQPLTIIGPTGPTIIFDELIYSICTRKELNYFAVRFWVACWIFAMALIMVALEGVTMIHYVTRFSEEIFSAVMAMTYLVEPMIWLYFIYKVNPVLTVYNQTNTTANVTDHHHYVGNPIPNVALLSSILLFGTASLAYILRRIRYKKSFTRWFRLFISDSALPIAIMLMICFDYAITQGDSFTKKLYVIKSSSKFARAKNGSIIVDLNTPMPVYVYIGCCIPAVLLFIVIFIETELCGMYIQDRLTMANGIGLRGSGYNMDLLLTAGIVLVNSLLQLPWVCVAPVRTVAHVSSLTIHSKTFAPGEKPKVISILDQRITNIAVHILLGLMVFAIPVLRHIALAILFGAFLYLGIVTLSCTQLYHRMCLITYADINLPYLPYARHVSSFKRNAYTLFQISLAIIILIVKFTDYAYIFPVLIVALVPIRILLMSKCFTEGDLMALDSEENIDNSEDFFSQIHFPP